MPTYSHGWLYSYTHAHKHVFAYAHELTHITLLHFTRTLTLICSTHSPHVTAIVHTQFSHAHPHALIPVYSHAHTFTPICSHSHTHVTHCTPHEHTPPTSVAYEKGERRSLKYLAQSPEHLKCFIMIYCS